LEEAKKNNALPLDDRTTMQIITLPRPTEEVATDIYTYYPHTSAVPEAVCVNIRGKSFKIIANVEITAESKGVIFAHGSRFGGHSLFIKDHKLYYVYNFLGIKEQQLVSTEALKPGKYTLGMEFTKEKAGAHGESEGTAKLYINDKAVATAAMTAQVGKFTLVGDGLCVGFDSGDPVSKQYTSPGEFEGGEISFVKVSTGKEQYLDLEMEAKRAWSKE
jgi:arylsulfatase